MSAWIALFSSQVLLIAMGRPDLHRRLGKAGFVLLALILVVAVPTVIVATRLGGSHMPGPALPGLALVIALFVEFLTLGSLGLYYRYRSEFHKRLMLLAAFAAMEAGVSRLPIEMLDSVEDPPPQRPAAPSGDHRRYGSASAPASCIRMGIRFFDIRSSVGNMVLRYRRMAAHCSNHHEIFP